MSNYDNPGSLDGAIDDAVREMMEVDPRPGFRQRVAGSIGGGSQPARRLRVRLAWAAGFAVIVLASVLLLRSPRPLQPVATPQVAVAPPAVPAALPAGPQAVDAPRPAPARAARRRDPAPEAIFGPQRNRVAAANVQVDADAVFEAPLFPAGLAAIAPISVAPIQVAPIAIAPLSVSPLSHRE